jgi:hypothetical protein
MTIELPPHRQDCLQHLLDSIPRSQKRISVRKWQQILGELQSMTIAIPGSRGLFSWMQETLRHWSENRIRLTTSVHDFVANFKMLHQDITTRPTRLYIIIPQNIPEILGASDACGYGISGIAFPQSNARLRQQTHSDGSAASGTLALPLEGTLPPIVWQYALPADVINKLVTFANPKGTISNSDLELLVTFIHNDVLATTFDIRERTLAVGTANTPALVWQGKGSVSTTGPAAYLLRMQALHQQFHRYNTKHFFIPGHLNSMADGASRLTHCPPLISYVILTTANHRNNPGIC